MSATVLANAVAVGRRILADPTIGARADTYDIRRAVATSDGAGGSTEVVSTVESGGCLLTAGARQPTEQAIVDQAGSTVPYIVRNIRHDTVLTAKDELLIAGRTFLVLGVLKNEAARVGVTAVCEERT